MPALITPLGVEKSLPFEQLECLFIVCSLVDIVQLQLMPDWYAVMPDGETSWKWQNIPTSQLPKQFDMGNLPSSSASSRYISSIVSNQNELTSIQTFKFPWASMECLGIPIDHRLRRLIREVRPIDTSGEESDHIRILQEFGTSLKIGTSDYLTPCDLSFGIEMARPESKGGIIVVLLQPHSSQDNSDGFLAGQRNCSTVKAVSELIHVTSNARFSFDDISVFDAIPFLNEKVTEPNIIGKAKDVFADMIRAKQPQIVISCFWTKTGNNTVKNLRRRKIGYCFESDPRGSKQLAESGLLLNRVNALHPSYAINFNPEFSCFKRLLVLEFVKAFALRQGNWTDEIWMARLRHECHEQAEKLKDGMYPSPVSQ